MFDVPSWKPTIGCSVDVLRRKSPNAEVRRVVSDIEDVNAERRKCQITLIQPAVPRDGGAGLFGATADRSCSTTGNDRRLHVCPLLAATAGPVNGGHG